MDKKIINHIIFFLKNRYFHDMNTFHEVNVYFMKKKVFSRSGCDTLYMIKKINKLYILKCPYPFS